MSPNSLFHDEEDIPPMAIRSSSSSSSLFSLNSPNANNNNNSGSEMDPLWHSHNKNSSSSHLGGLYDDSTDPNQGKVLKNHDDDPFLLDQLMRERHDEEEACMYDAEIAAMLAAELNQQQQKQQQIRRPAPVNAPLTWKDKVCGVVVGVIIFGAFVGLIILAIHTGKSVSSTSQEQEQHYTCPEVQAFNMSNMLLEQVQLAPSLCHGEVVSTSYDESNNEYYSEMALLRGESEQVPLDCSCRNPILSSEGTTSLSQEEINDIMEQDFSNSSNNNETTASTSPDVVFLGMPPMMEGHLNEIGGVSFGGEEERLASMVYRIENGFLPASWDPKVFWITLGAPDLVQDSCALPVVHAGILQLVERLMDLVPTAQIVLGHVVAPANEHNDDHDNESLSSSSSLTEILSQWNERLECTANRLEGSVTYFDPNPRPLTVDKEDFFLDAQFASSSSSSKTTKVTPEKTSNDPGEAILAKLSELLNP